MKKKAALILASLFVLILFFRAAPPPPPPTYADLIDSFELFPPIVKHIWVQKLPTPLMDGSNMTVKIEYESDIPIPDTLQIFYAFNDTAYVKFNDRGDNADASAGDYIYSAYVKENIGSFVAKMESLEASLAAQDSFINFTGHVGELITDLPEFDADAFGDGQEVEINSMLINAADCETAIKKQNSLFITDLSVVEDQDRTFNVVNRTGNPWGKWTFGQLMKNIANEPATGVSAKTFLKNWLLRWTDGATVNGQTIPARRGVMPRLIGPWLQRAHAKDVTPYASDYYQQIDGQGDQWKTDWDNTNQDSLLKYAPFKLIAIVNRLDLRGNLAYYSRSFSNGGETRFIFTLVAPFDLYLETKTDAGKPPRAADGMAGSTCNNPIDWEGMNVILEYGNPISDGCDLRDFAQEWLDLSAFTFPSATFNDALEDITDQITAAGIVSGKENGSAIDQVRTNERIFLPVGCDFTHDPSAQQGWFDSDWELSQFEIEHHNASPYYHCLVPSPVSLTPENQNNSPWNYKINSTFSTSFISSGGTYSKDAMNSTTFAPGAIALIDWVLTIPNAQRVALGNYVLPLSYTEGSSTFHLSAVARMDMDQLHYWDLPWYTSSTTHYTHIADNDPSPHMNEKRIRHQLSLNTCQGCHGGETKTLFTQIRPVGYGEAIDYWNANPVNDWRVVDDRPTRIGGFSANQGTSFITANGTTPESNYVYPTSTIYTSRLSGFLTGRYFTGVYPTGTWEDDYHDAGKDPYDNQMTNKSLYYVYDPTNNHDGTNDHSYPKPDTVFSYNDLEMRKQRLCQLVNLQCGTPSAKLPGLFAKVLILPLPPHGH